MVLTETPATDWAPTLFADLPDAIFVVDAEHRRIVDANRAAQKMTGLSQNDLPAFRIDQLLHWQENGSQADTVIASASSAAAPAEPRHSSGGYRWGLLHHRKTGAIPVQAATFLISGSKGRRWQVVVARDGRPLRALESGNHALMERIAALEVEAAQLRESTGHSGFYSSDDGNLGSHGPIIQGIAKQFNDLATVIIAGSTLVRSSINSTSPNQTFLRSIEEATERVSELFRDLMAAVGRSPFHRTEEPLGRIIEEALQQTQSPAGVSIKSSVASTLPPLWCDRDLLLRTIARVFQNAMDAMPQGGSLTIDAAQVQMQEKDLKAHAVLDTAKPGIYIKIRIADTGPGMTTEQLDQAGKPFYSTKNDPKKPGLGLAVAKGVCLRHGGWLEISSAKGKGTSVTIYLPQVKNKADG